MQEAKILVKQIYETWKVRRTVHPGVLLWPSKTLTIEEARINLASHDLPEDATNHRKLLTEAVDFVHAYAFFYFRREGSEIKAILESPHGTASWVIPIVRSADVEILKAASMKTDKDFMAILWTPKQGTS